MFCKHWFCILITHLEAFFRTYLYAITARNALESCYVPCFFFSSNNYGASGTFSLAHSAEYTSGNIYRNTASCKLRQHLWAKRIFNSSGFSEQALQDCLCHYKKLHIYLSVQLMHGSIVRTNTGTSARLLPGSIFTKLGIFANVGVLTLRRCKNLVPFALA